MAVVAAKSWRWLFPLQEEPRGRLGFRGGAAQCLGSFAIDRHGHHETYLDLEEGV
jgi:hypothetical protein